jgi:hypothetical protein
MPREGVKAPARSADHEEDEAPQGDNAKGWVSAALLFLAATLMFVAPLLRHAASMYPHDPGDPSLNAWILWWSTQRLPLTDAWWNAPMFYPMRGALALSEVLIGILPVTLPVQALTGSPLVAYNTAFVLTFPLCALAMYALARELTGDHAASLLAGAAYAFSPYRMSQLGHLQVLAYYGAPIALLGLHRYARLRLEPGATGTRWLCLFGAGWLLQSLSNGYAMFHLAVFVVLWLFWFARSRAVAIPVVVTWIVASVPLVPVLLKYQSIHSSLHLTRDINEVRGYGIGIADLFTSAPELIVWSRLLPPAGVERAAFPGIALLIAAVAWLAAGRPRGRSAVVPPRVSARMTLDRALLASVAAVALLVTLVRVLLGPWHIGPLTVTEARKPISIAMLAIVVLLSRSRWIRTSITVRSVPVFYIVAMAAMYVLALGPAPKLFDVPFLYRPPYEWLMALPGYSTLRVPARFLALAMLSGSVLIAILVARVRTIPRFRTVIVAVAAVSVLIDAAARLPVQPSPPRGPTWSGADAVIELPAGHLADFAAIHRSMIHGLPILNGYSGYFPHHYLPLMYALDHGHLDVLKEFPAARGIAISIDRSDSRSLEMSAAIRSLDGSTHLGASDRLDTFLLRNSSVALPTLGGRLRISAVTANRTPEDARRMLDDRMETAWRSGPSQVGDEEVTADLGATGSIGAISMGMGSFAFGFPRSLDVEISLDGHTWTRVSSGPTDVLAVRGALADPGRVPITIGIGHVVARYIRLRQTAHEPDIPWWIAELTVYGPADGAPHTEAPPHVR